MLKKVLYKGIWGSRESSAEASLGRLDEIVESRVAERCSMLRNVDPPATEYALDCSVDGRFKLLQFILAIVADTNTPCYNRNTICINQVHKDIDILTC